MNIEKLKYNTLVNYENDDVKSILKMADTYDHEGENIGGLTSEQLNDIIEYMTQARDGRELLNNYYIIKDTKAVKYKSLVYNYIYNFFKLLNDDEINDESKLKTAIFNHLHANGVRGIRQDWDIRDLFLKLARLNCCDNIEKLENMTAASGGLIVYVGNDPIAQLTCSYSKYFTSCYNFTGIDRQVANTNGGDYGGCYRHINLYMIADNNNYIIKVFKDTPKNRELVETDALKYNDDCISRCNFLKVGGVYHVASVYGYTDGASINEIDNIQELINTAFNTTTKKLNRWFSYSTCVPFYNEFGCHTKATFIDAEKIDEYVNNRVIVGSDYIADLLGYCITPSRIANIKDICALCLTETDDITRTDDGVRCCCDCCWYSDADGVYYSNNIHGRRTPFGTCRADDIDGL